MFGSGTLRWLGSLWLLLISVGLFTATVLIPRTSLFPEASSSAGEQWVVQYNLISHTIFLIGLTAACSWLIWAAHRSDQRSIQETNKSSLAKRCADGIKKHPVVTGLFSFYTILMIQHTSWFYKEIIGWYKDIIGSHLLNNFALRWEITKETMLRNDFRFYPLAHQDLHILSWFTPYVKVWMLVNAAELFLIVILGSKIIEALSEHENRQETLLMFSILFLFDAATGFTFFQFIYSERLVVLFFALLYALIGLYFKDTAFLLFTIPAFLVILAGSMGLISQKPRFNTQSLREWCMAYALELSLCGLILVFGVSFLYLSYLPSLYVGVDAYDSHLRFSRFEPNLRFLVLLSLSIIRMLMIVMKKVSFSLLDAFNAAALAYALGLYAMVGFRSSNYMALPVQFVASMDIVMLYIWATTQQQANHRIKAGVLGLTSLLMASSIVGLEHQERRNFWKRIQRIQIGQDSWVKTLDQMKEISRTARENGEEINIIYSKSLFRNRDHLKQQLAYNRLIYFNLEKNEYTVIDGTDKGLKYIPQKGDFLLNIDTGKRLFDDGLNDSQYQKIYDYDSKRSTGKIYRRVQ